MMGLVRRVTFGLALLVALAGCGESARIIEAEPMDILREDPALCTIAEGSDPDFAAELGCRADYAALASEPTDASIPGATSVKVVVDRADGNALYFQNSKRYCVHWDFAASHLSGGHCPWWLRSASSTPPNTTAPIGASSSARCRTTTGRTVGLRALALRHR